MTETDLPTNSPNRNPRAFAEVIAELSASGLTQHQLTLLLELVSIATVYPTSTRHRVDTIADRRRKWDREYKKRKRKQQLNGIGSKKGVSTSCLPDSPSERLSSIVSVSIARGGEGSRERGRTIPDDWYPKPQHYAAGRQLGLTDHHVMMQAQDMRLWAEANANRAVARKKDWDKTFTLWMRRNQTKGNGHETARDQRKNRWNEALDQLGRFAEDSDSSQTLI